MSRTSMMPSFVAVPKLFGSMSAWPPMYSRWVVTKMLRFQSEPPGQVVAVGRVALERHLLDRVIAVGVAMLKVVTIVRGAVPHP